MEIKNGLLILCMRSARIRTYSMTDYSFLSAFESRETGTLTKINQILKSSSPHLYIMNVNNLNEVRKYQIDSLGQPVLLQSGFTGISNSMNRPYIVHDSLILYDEFIPDASLKIHSLHTNSEERALPYGTTSLYDRFIDKNMGGLYANDSCIAFVYKYQDKIEFYDWQFNLKHTVDHQKTEPVIYQPETGTNMSPPKNILYYGSAYMGRNYLYTLYRGVTNRVFRSDSVPIYGGRSHVYGLTRDVLEVYELDGQPICRFRFDDVSPAVFVVDEEQNRLIGYRGAYYDSLLVYQLQGLPKNGKRDLEPQKPTRHSSLPAVSPPERPKAFLQGISFGGGRDVAPMYFVYEGRYGIYFPVIEIGKTIPMADKL